MLNILRIANHVNFITNFFVKRARWIIDNSDQMNNFINIADCLSEMYPNLCVLLLHLEMV
ncbi:hypothetical protein BG74_06960 [Sodalis-like endosymbiont of Proechinophthirus fluctus]|nr:hypothetical protein BG74_06960 [Sodalis-like endosymbiont of Proechinophthirus fluctus]